MHPRTLFFLSAGTNWAYNNGANGGGTDFEPVITSYDYDAPVSEGGGHGYGHDGDKYDAIRRILGYWAPASAPPPEPPAPAVTAYAPLVLSSSAGLLPNLATLAPVVIASLSVRRAAGVSPAFR